MVQSVRGLLSLLVLVSLIGLAPGSQAQDGSSFTGSDGTIYLHITRTPAFKEWSNALAADPANEGSDDGLNALAFALGEGTATFDFPFEPDLSAPVEIVKGQDVLFDLWVGGSDPSMQGQVSVTASVVSGSTVIATASADAVTYMGDMHEVSMTGPAQVDALAAGDALSVHVELTGAGTFIHMGNGDPTQSKVQLPIVANAAAGGNETFQDLKGPTVTLSNDLPNATTRTDHYNWTADAGPYVLTANLTLANGTVAVVVRDGNGTEAYNQTLVETGNSTTVLPAHAPGNWTITVHYEAFQGTFKLGISRSSDTGTTTSSTSHSTSKSATATSTESSSANTTTSSSGKKSPAPGLPTLVMGVVLLAVLLRRRR